MKGNHHPAGHRRVSNPHIPIPLGIFLFCQHFAAKRECSSLSLSPTVTLPSLPSCSNPSIPLFSSCSLLCQYCWQCTELCWHCPGQWWESQVMGAFGRWSLMATLYFYMTPPPLMCRFLCLSVNSPPPPPMLYLYSIPVAGVSAVYGGSHTPSPPQTLSIVPKLYSIPVDHVGSNMGAAIPSSPPPTLME